MRIVIDAVGLREREVYLYDLFEHDPSMLHHAMPEHGPELYARVRERFAADPNVTVIRARFRKALRKARRRRWRSPVST